MKITITSESTVTNIEGVPVRHWKGVTESGVKCHVFVHRIAVHKNDPAEEFERELREMDPPAGPKIVDLRHIL